MAAATVADKTSPTMTRFRTQAPTFLQLANELVVDSDESMAVADQHLSAIATFRKGVQQLFAPILEKSKAAVDAAKASHKQNQESQQELLAPADQADTLLRDKVLAQHKVRQAEVERQRLASQAAATKDAVTDQKAKATHLKKIGRMTGDTHYLRAAEQVMAQPVRAAVPALPIPEKAPIKNTIVQHVSITVDDKVRLCIAVAEACIDRLRRDGTSDELIASLRAGRAPLGSVQPDEKWLRKQAEQDGDAFDIPGVTRHVNDGLSVRAR
jgi:hypothetical protein